MSEVTAIRISQGLEWRDGRYRMAVAELPNLYPTLPGKVRGIIGWDPLRLQCGECGAIHGGGQPRRYPAWKIRAMADCRSCAGDPYYLRKAEYQHRAQLARGEVST